MKRVLVVDDHSLFRDGVVSLLEAGDYEVVAQAETGEQALELARALLPELVLMDIHMPGMGGLAALRQIKTELPGIYVVMLTVSEDDDELLTAVKYGANGFLAKQIQSAEFVQMLAGLEKGDAAISRKTMTQLLQSIPKQQAREKVGPLSEREREVLLLVARGKSNREIAESIGLSENTVKFHLKTLMQKLNAANRAEAVMLAAQKKLI
jgi:DNA-binding NarL/FixJ family response regulator